MTDSKELLGGVGSVPSDLNASLGRVYATNAQQADAGVLVAWLQSQLADASARVEAGDRELTTAKALGFRVDHVARELRVQLKRVSYLRKLQAAVTNGYTVIPNLFGEVFAIRVSEDSQPAMEHRSHYKSHAAVLSADGDGLELGAGVWRDAIPRSRQSSRDTDEHHKHKWIRTAIGWQDVAFPPSVRGVEMVQAVHAGMQLKAFDDIAVSPQRSTRRDPIIYGRIQHYRNTDRYVCFAICYYLDVEDLA